MGFRACLISLGNGSSGKFRILLDRELKIRFSSENMLKEVRVAFTEKKTFAYDTFQVSLSFFCISREKWFIKA